MIRSNQEAKEVEKNTCEMKEIRSTAEYKSFSVRKWEYVDTYRVNCVASARREPELKLYFAQCNRPNRQSASNLNCIKAGTMGLPTFQFYEMAAFYFRVQI